jgi:tetratricopeptide (TPR) repeat protein
MECLEDLKSLLSIISSQEFNDGGWRFICRDDFTTFFEIGFLNATVCSLNDRIGELLEGRKQHLEATKYYDNSRDCYSALLPLVEETPEEVFANYGDSKEMVVTTIKKAKTTAWMNMGLAYKFAGDLEECERCYKEGIALNPEGCQLHNCVTLYMNGYFPARVQQAKGILKQMKRLIDGKGGTLTQQDLSNYHWDWYKVHYEEGKARKALESVAEAIKYNTISSRLPMLQEAHQQTKYNLQRGGFLRPTNQVGRGRDESGAAICAYCKKPAKAGKKLKSCSKCKGSFYCSRECQVKDWRKGHKKVCMAIKEVKVNMVSQLTGQTGRTLTSEGWNPSNEELNNGDILYGVD